MSSSSSSHVRSVRSLSPQSDHGLEASSTTQDHDSLDAFEESSPSAHAASHSALTPAPVSLSLEALLASENINIDDEDSDSDFQLDSENDESAKRKLTRSTHNPEEPLFELGDDFRESSTLFVELDGDGETDEYTRFLRRLAAGQQPNEEGSEDDSANASSSDDDDEGEDEDFVPQEEEIVEAQREAEVTPRVTVDQQEVELLKRDASKSIYHALNVAPSGRPVVRKGRRKHGGRLFDETAYDDQSSMPPLVLTQRQRERIQSQIALHMQLLTQTVFGADSDATHELADSLMGKWQDIRKESHANMRRAYTWRRPLPATHKRATRSQTKSVQERLPVPAMASVFDQPILQKYKSRNAHSKPSSSFADLARSFRRSDAPPPYLNEDPFTHSMFVREFAIDDKAYELLARRKQWNDEKLKKSQSVLPQLKALEGLTGEDKRTDRCRWTRSENMLFDMGLNEYGLSLLRNRSIDDTGYREKLPILVPDLDLIQRRFLPGKTLRMVRVKFSNEKTRSRSRAHDFIKKPYRAKSRPMPTFEKKIVIKFVREHGTQWALLAKTLLPNWDRKALRRIWARYIEPELRRRGIDPFVGREDIAEEVERKKRPRAFEGEEGDGYGQFADAEAPEEVETSYIDFLANGGVDEGDRSARGRARQLLLQRQQQNPSSDGLPPRRHDAAAMELSPLSLPEVDLRLPPAPTAAPSSPRDNTEFATSSLPTLPPLPPFPSLPLPPPPLPEEPSSPPTFAGSVVEKSALAAPSVDTKYSFGAPPPLPPPPMDVPSEMVADVDSFPALQLPPPPPPPPPPLSTLSSLTSNASRNRKRSRNAVGNSTPVAPLSAAQALLSLQKGVSTKTEANRDKEPPRKRKRVDTDAAGASQEVDVEEPNPFADARIDGGEALGLASFMSEDQRRVIAQMAERLKAHASSSSSASTASSSVSHQRVNVPPLSIVTRSSRRGKHAAEASSRPHSPSSLSLTSAPSAAAGQAGARNFKGNEKKMQRTESDSEYDADSEDAVNRTRKSEGGNRRVGETLYNSDSSSPELIEFLSDDSDSDADTSGVETETKHGEPSAGLARSPASTSITSSRMPNSLAPRERSLPLSPSPSPRAATPSSSASLPRKKPALDISLPSGGLRSKRVPRPATRGTTSRQDVSESSRLVRKEKLRARDKPTTSAVSSKSDAVTESEALCESESSIEDLSMSSRSDWEVDEDSALAKGNPQERNAPGPGVPSVPHLPSDIVSRSKHVPVGRSSGTQRRSGSFTIPRVRAPPTHPVVGDDLDDLFTSVGNATVAPMRRKPKKRQRAHKASRSSKLAQPLGLPASAKDAHSLSAMMGSGSGSSMMLQAPPSGSGAAPSSAAHSASSHASQPLPPSYDWSDTMRHPAVSKKGLPPPHAGLPPGVPDPAALFPLTDPFSNMQAVGTVMSLPPGCVPLSEVLSMQSQGKTASGMFSFLTQPAFSKPTSSSSVLPLNAPPIPIQFSPLPLQQTQNFTFPTPGGSSSATASDLPPPPVPYVAPPLPYVAPMSSTNSTPEEHPSATHLFPQASHGSSNALIPSSVATVAPGSINAHFLPTQGILSGLSVPVSSGTPITGFTVTPTSQSTSSLANLSSSGGGGITAASTSSSAERFMAPEGTMVEHFEQLERQSSAATANSENAPSSRSRVPSASREHGTDPIEKESSHRDDSRSGDNVSRGSGGREHKWTRSEDAELYKMSQLFGPSNVESDWPSTHALVHRWGAGVVQARVDLLKRKLEEFARKRKAAKKSNK